MPLNFDTERLPGDTDTLLDLVRAIVASSDRNGERSWIEWKSCLDLGVAAGRFKLAKEILAMANRDVERARNYCHGWGYIVVGASEEGIHGIAPTSTSNLEQALAPYLGTGRRAPRWEPQLLDMDGHQILVVQVEPPREGDPIYTLDKEFERFLAGLVFARGVETAQPATPDQMTMLQHRLVSRGARDVAMERIALVCSTQGWDVEFEAAAIPADRAFAWVTHQTGSTPVSVWVEFVESGNFPRHDAIVNMFRTMAADHVLVVVPEWADEQRVDLQVAALLKAEYGDVYADAGPFIGICSSSFGGIHTALRTLINLGRDGTAFPRMNLRAYRIPVQRPWR